MVGNRLYDFVIGILMAGIGLFVACIGISIIRGQSMSFEHEKFKLIIGAYLVQEASDNLQQSAETSAIAPAKKQEIKNLTDQITIVLKPVLEQFEPDINIDLDTDQLIPLDEQ